MTDNISTLRLHYLVMLYPDNRVQIFSPYLQETLIKKVRLTNALLSKEKATSVDKLTGFQIPKQQREIRFSTHTLQTQQAPCQNTSNVSRSPANVTKTELVGNLSESHFLLD